jgi:hypothetical protein
MNGSEITGYDQMTAEEIARREIRYGDPVNAVELVMLWHGLTEDDATAVVRAADEEFQNGGKQNA